MKLQMTSPLRAGFQQAEAADISYIFHENTKLSNESARRLSRSFYVSHAELFVSNRAFKQHRNAKAVALLDDETCNAKIHSQDLPEILSTRRSTQDLSSPLTLEQLSSVIEHSLGATCIYPTEEEGINQLRRAWPSAGGLYPIDTYILAQKVTGISPGIYSHNVPKQQLEKMPNERDVAEIIRDGFLWQDWITSAAAIIVFVGVMSRNQTKYGARGYRLMMLDAGHAGQNLLLTSAALGLNSCPIGGFNDDALAYELGVNGYDEAVIHAVAIGGCDDTSI